MDTFDIVGIQIKVMTTTINFLIIADGNADNEKLITYLDINGKSRFQISRRSTIPSYRRKQKTKKTNVILIALPIIVLIENWLT